MPINTPTGYLDITNATLRGSKIVTTGFVGIANANPTNHLSIGSNLHINDTHSNVLQVSGNINAASVVLGGISIAPTFDLEVITNTGNTTPNTLEFNNAATAFVTTAGATIGGTLTANKLTGDGSGISAIQSSNVTDFASNVSRITTLETDLDNNSARITNLSSNLSDNSTRITNLSSNLSDNSARITNLSSNLSDNSSRITALESGDISISGDKTFTGDIIFESNVHMNGGNVFVANTVNMTVSDPIIELGSNNSGTNDLGIIMTRLGATNSNIALVYDESDDILKMGYTLNGANDSIISLDSNALAVSVQGELTVGSNLEVGTANLFVDTLTSRVGIGTTTPGSTLQVGDGTAPTTGDATGSISLYGTGETKSNGNKPGLYHRSGVGLGLWSDAHMSFEVNGHNGGQVEAMRITSSGNVGIGSTSPGGPLHVKAVGSTTLTNESPMTNGIFVYNDQNSANQDASVGIRVAGSSAGDPFLSFDIANEYGWAWGMDNSDGNKMKLGANWHTVSNDTKMTIDTSGNVGIGTASPLQTLNVKGNGQNPVIYMTDGTNNRYASGMGTHNVTNEGQRLDFYNGDSGANGTSLSSSHIRMSIDASGNVGIGEPSPETKLHITNTDDSTGTGDAFISGLTTNSSNRKPTECLRLQGNWRSPGSGALLRFTNYHGGGTNPNTSEYNTAGIAGFDYSNQWGGGLCLYTAPNTSGGGDLTPRMVIDSSGNVGIGTTSPGCKLDIAATSGYTPAIRIGTNTTYDSGQLYSLAFGGSTLMGMGLYASSQTVFGAQGLGIHIPNTEEFSIRSNNWSKLFALDGATDKAYFGGNVGIGTTGPSGRFEVRGTNATNGAAHFRGNGPAVHIQPVTGTGGGQNLFTGYRTGDSYGRGQLVLSSAYSDIIIASSQINNNHGSNLSFVTYDPNNFNAYRKFVINQGNWGSRKQFLDFGYGDKADPNPHGYINSTDTVMTLDGVNKRMGIGTITPSYGKLHINGNSAGAWPNYYYFNGNGGLSHSTNWSLANTSLYASGGIVAGDYVAASDERIKKDIVDADDSECLEALRLLKPKRYRYKDELDRGEGTVWGFIAQEVRETLPHSTKLLKSVVPNIYEMANVSSSNVITFTNFNTADLESNATTFIRTMGADGAEHGIHLEEVIDEHTIRVKEDLTDWIGSVDETGNIIAGTQLFVYGQEVDNFVFLKKDAVWTTATAALQEVDRQLQAEKTKTATLETQVASLLERVTALENA